MNSNPESMDQLYIEASKYIGVIKVFFTLFGKAKNTLSFIDL